jgi:hypothetical protein
MGQTATGNVLANANVPSGQTAVVTGFSIADSTQVYPVGSTVTLTDPLTGQPIGTLTISSTGDFSFDPEDGYLGPTPAINVYSKTSTGTTAVSSLTLDVVQGMALHHSRLAPPRGHHMAISCTKCLCGMHRGYCTHAAGMLLRDKTRSAEPPPVTSVCILVHLVLQLHPLRCHQS